MNIATAESKRLHHQSSSDVLRYSRVDIACLPALCLRDYVGNEFLKSTLLGLGWFLAAKLHSTELVTARMHAMPARCVGSVLSYLSHCQRTPATDILTSSKGFMLGICRRTARGPWFGGDQTLPSLNSLRI